MSNMQQQQQLDEMEGPCIQEALTQRFFVEAQDLQLTADFLNFGQEPNTVTSGANLDFDLELK